MRCKLVLRSDLEAVTLFISHVFGHGQLLVLHLKSKVFFTEALESQNCVCSFFNDLRIALGLLIKCNRIDWLITETLFQLLLIGSADVWY